MCRAHYVCLCVSDLQACVLSSVELQVLTGACFKLRTVHNIPVTSNKDGKRETALCSVSVLSSFSYRWRDQMQMLSESRGEESRVKCVGDINFQLFRCPES